MWAGAAGAGAGAGAATTMGEKAGMGARTVTADARNSSSIGQAFKAALRSSTPPRRSPLLEDRQHLLGQECCSLSERSKSSSLYSNTDPSESELERRRSSYSDSSSDAADGAYLGVLVRGLMKYGAVAGGVEWLEGVLESLSTEKRECGMEGSRWNAGMCAGSAWPSQLSSSKSELDSSESKSWTTM